MRFEWYVIKKTLSGWEKSPCAMSKREAENLVSLSPAFLECKVVHRKSLKDYGVKGD